MRLWQVALLLQLVWAAAVEGVAVAVVLRPLLPPLLAAQAWQQVLELEPAGVVAEQR